MFGEFLNIIVRSIKLDKTLYKDNKNFGEAAIYFAGLIVILGGIAGAVAANTVVKTPIAMSGLTQILNWFVWTILIYVIGVKIFPTIFIIIFQMFKLFLYIIMTIFQ